LYFYTALFNIVINLNNLIMKKLLLLSVLLVGVIVLFSKCGKVKEPSLNQANNVIDQSVVDKFKAKGFNTDLMEKRGDAYLVEGCTMVTEKELDNMTEPFLVDLPNGEQYRTYNLVNKPLTIKVAGPTTPAKINTAIDQAIANYNAQGLQITFVRTTGTADITVKVVSGSAGGVSGFPSGGKPYSSVTIYSKTANYSQGVVSHVVIHEIGHCIGFRHSDYFNRSLSCGIGGNEGASSVGAVYIPNTATGFDSGSIMNSCFSTTSTANFSAYDIVALSQLYK